MAVDLPVGRRLFRLWLLAVFLLPAAVVWSAVGLASGTLGLRTVAVPALAVYAIYYGATEVISGRGLPSPSSRWQVPQVFVKGVGRRLRAAVWGALLGPGFFTRNPYAGFGALILVLLSIGQPRPALLTGVGIGLAHALGRSVAMMRTVDGKLPGEGNLPDHLAVVVRTIRWRVTDGYALVTLAGLVIAIGWDLL